jgi:hypothetical protein
MIAKLLSNVSRIPAISAIPGRHQRLVASHRPRIKQPELSAPADAVEVVPAACRGAHLPRPDSAPPQVLLPPPPGAVRRINSRQVVGTRPGRPPRQTRQGHLHVDSDPKICSRVKHESPPDAG